jgi:hypothetical protein
LIANRFGFCDGLRASPADPGALMSRPQELPM